MKKEKTELVKFLTLLLPYRHSTLEEQKYSTVTRHPCQKSLQSLQKTQV